MILSMPTIGLVTAPCWPTLVGLGVSRPTTMKKIATTWIASWMPMVARVALQNWVFAGLPRACPKATINQTSTIAEAREKIPV